MFKMKKFDVEHAIGMYAYSIYHFPATSIYDDSAMGILQPYLERCHIYFIGTLPTIDVRDVESNRDTFTIHLEVSGKILQQVWPIPRGASLVKNSNHWHIRMPDGQLTFPPNNLILERLAEQIDDYNFKILYIGQAYGDDGSRNAIDRLLKHEKLQKIAVLGIPNDQTLTIVTIEVMPATRLVTVLNPHARNQDSDGTRMSMGLDKLYNTSEAERVTLYEASLIRYFQPKYNVEFMNNFPSTSMKLLKDCYSKDFNAVVAELIFDDMPFMFYTDTIQPQPYHSVIHNLHKKKDRDVFFGINT